MEASEAVVRPWKRMCDGGSGCESVEAIVRRWKRLCVGGSTLGTVVKVAVQSQQSRAVEAGRWRAGE
ncbi:hypothetical protein MIMGU_mgv1a018361mg [Erythranthe guttata]|uniref:Uncharacterized protein n=1 Tax=Erythranthe guttata TaxID=4155 RepID=A0A022QN36_ERYGU|nr:hypothetical protein MIMGU_mgv1a018361mg [Erythranthe guttata]